MQPGYLPWLGFFELMANCECFVLLDDVQHTKKDWRSRNRIRTKDGCAWLTVPVYTKNKRFQLINEVEINNSISWRKKHLRAIEINYSRARYFSKYFPYLEKKYYCDWRYLVDFNVELIIFLKEKLGIKIPVFKSSLLNIDGTKEIKIINICKKLGAQELYDSKAASTFLNANKFQKENIRVEFQDYSHPVYEQMYKPFMPYMCIIDLLLQYGPDSLNILLNKR